MTHAVSHESRAAAVNHSPGPWRLSISDALFVWGPTTTSTEDHPLACAFIGHYDGLPDLRSREEAIANARLIAAAPDLLDALMAFFNIHHGEGLLDIDIRAFEQARRLALDVIAKATTRGSNG